MKQKIYFHIPGFFEFFNLNKSLIEMKKENPEYFYDDFEIGSIYGTFPNAIWNGGRVCFGICFKETMVKIIKYFNDNNIPLRYTFTNSLLTEDHVNDTYCNLIMQLSDNGINQVLVNNNTLEEYIRTKYPKYKIISSTTKRITNKKNLEKEIKKDYYLVVLDYDLNKDIEYLNSIKEKNKIEILVDELCMHNCPYRKEHYKQFSISQLEFSNQNSFVCNYSNIDNDNIDFNEISKNVNFITRDELEKYKKMGFINYKLVGRNTNINFVIDSYIHYFVKDKYKNEVKFKLLMSINNENLIDV